MAEGINTGPLWGERLGVPMVKRPRQVMRYSPSAGKHTLHTVERVQEASLEAPLGSATLPPCHGGVPWFPTSKTERT